MHDGCCWIQAIRQRNDFSSDVHLHWFSLSDAFASDNRDIDDLQQCEWTRRSRFFFFSGVLVCQNIYQCSSRYELEHALKFVDYKKKRKNSPITNQIGLTSNRPDLCHSSLLLSFASAFQRSAFWRKTTARKPGASKRNSSLKLMAMPNTSCACARFLLLFRFLSLFFFLFSLSFLYS